MTKRIGFSILMALAVAAALPAVASDDVTLDGGFVWQRDDGNHEGDLRAVLTPAGDGAWTVAFHFDWEDGPHVYTGSCSGSLDGALSGDVVSDGDGDMKFKFEGAFKDGRFSGTHGFVTEEGGLKQSGTIELALPAES